MTLVIVQNRSVLAIPNLLRLVAKFIYDQKNMTFDEERTMQRSFVTWSEAIKLEREKLAAVQAADLKIFGKRITTEHKYSEEEMQLEVMAKMLKESEENHPNVTNWKRHLAEGKLTDYRKLPMFRFPEAYEKQDFINGKKAHEEAKAANPEEYA